MKWLIRSGVFACVAAGAALTMAAALLIVTLLVQLNALGAFRVAGGWFAALGTWVQTDGMFWITLSGFVIVVASALVVVVMLGALAAGALNKHLRRVSER